MSGKKIMPDFDVSRETIERLKAFVRELTRWNKAINLVSPKTLSEVWSRHILDSAQLLDEVPSATKHWVDLGTGGGFPGLVVAILAKELRPALSMTCLESDKRKAAFLASQVRALGLTAKIIPERIETTAPQNADVVSARALAPMDRLLELAHPHLSKNGLALFLKGANCSREISEAKTHWRFRFDVIPSKTDQAGAIVKLGDLERV